MCIDGWSKRTFDLARRPNPGKAVQARGRAQTVLMLPVFKGWACRRPHRFRLYGVMLFAGVDEPHCMGSRKVPRESFDRRAVERLSMGRNLGNLFAVE